MAVKRSHAMAERLKAMLTKDKMGVHAGFMSALTGDLSRVLGDYFDIAAPPSVAVSLDDDGTYDITVSAKATRIKRFDTTQDLPKPES